MAGQNNKKYQFRFDLALIFSITSSLAIAASNILPISALEIPHRSEEFRIAKTPDEREPEAVQQGIEQIPTSEPPVTPAQRSQPIDSPIPARVSPQVTNPTPQPSEGVSTPAPSGTGNTNPTPQPSEGVSTPAPSGTGNTNPTPQPSEGVSTPAPTRRRYSNPTPQPSEGVSTPAPTRRRYSNPTPQPSEGVSTPAPTRRRYSNPTPQTTPSSGRNLKPIPNQGRVRNQIPKRTPVYSFVTPPYKKINFVDIAFGILSKNDFKSQGRYFHFYQFEGRENQLIQIRLIGSADQRRSNNLRLSPFLFLLDPNNNVILKRGSAGTTSAAGDAFIFARLPVKGTYTIAVTSQNPGDTGRYSLALRDDRASYALDESGELTARSSVIKRNGSPYNVSKFEGKKNQLVSIRVDSINEEFSPYIVLLNSKGERIAANNGKDGLYTALIDRARLPEDDTYYLIVTSNNPRERGTYRLTVF
ncbi:pre-peptidase C-terminal domain-containing protein [Nostoc sp. CENA67]|uniref:Pre-peptidase C-terminal domain-containing protein n=1 Tax=Amazonocrinis nigriterrae CENA67 TaxID=2794033 RepID=A0A8J7LAD0_9NOST|nr:PPC domain-containing protein [Amazonocrinis nigriterrae]MBH8565373.1 pre-peptidase C-terminal domain-containing protein [Amazonocrinis nigriterrae CENA67]